MRKTITRSERTELEKMFLGFVLADADDGKDLRKVTAEYPVTWRDFCDKRHRALWRIMETADLLSYTERVDILLDEAYAAPDKANPFLNAPGDNLVAGEEGSAQRRQFDEEISARSKASSWLERELEKNGQLYLVGGREYLREMRELRCTSPKLREWINDLGFLGKEDVAEKLGFIWH